MDAWEPPNKTPLTCGLPKAWANTPAWRILDTEFEIGQAFLATWQLWRDDPLRSGQLHFVGLTPTAPLLETLLSFGTQNPVWRALLDELAPHWFGLLPGFHRISLDGGQVLLTLCIGPTLELLRQQHFYADTVYLGNGAPGHPEPWDIWTAKALARCCRRGTSLRLRQPQPSLQAILAHCGFVFDRNDDFVTQGAVFDPHWALKTTRGTLTREPTPPGTCAVVGAGLAGASVAASLARRGWQVVVLDGGATPASGASDLPVGLLAPHDSTDDCKLSQLSRAGVRLTLGEATRLLEPGQDWALSGSTEFRFDGALGLPEHCSPEGADWSLAVSPDLPDHRATASFGGEVEAGLSAIWHARSAWIKPAQLVRSWLSLPNITFQPNAQVTTVARENEQWLLRNAQGHPLVCVDRVVFANAMGAFPLMQQLQRDCPELPLQLDRIPAVHGVRGQVSFGLHMDSAHVTFPAAPINGAGSVIPHIPTTDGLTWFVGSSFQPDTRPDFSTEKNHGANFGRLQKLSPALATQLKPHFEGHRVRHWNSTRCVTADRLPIVGALGDPQRSGLWVCAGMGSRGLSFSVLCAELLAAQWSGEPLPIEFNLAQSLNALRAAHSTTP